MQTSSAVYECNLFALLQKGQQLSYLRAQVLQRRFLIQIVLIGVGELNPKVFDVVFGAELLDVLDRLEPRLCGHNHGDTSLFH